jgi:hypothetical protein
MSFRRVVLPAGLLCVHKGEGYFLCNLHCHFRTVIDIPFLKIKTPSLVYDYSSIYRCPGPEPGFQSSSVLMRTRAAELNLQGWTLAAVFLTR